MLEFEFDGVVTTNEADDQTLRADLDVRLVRVDLRLAHGTDRRLVYRHGPPSGERRLQSLHRRRRLACTKERLGRGMQAEMESNGGFVGMGL